MKSLLALMMMSHDDDDDDDREMLLKIMNRPGDRKEEKTLDTLGRENA